MPPQCAILLPVDSSPLSSASSASSLSPPPSPNDHPPRDIHDEDAPRHRQFTCANERGRASRHHDKQRKSASSPRYLLPPKPPSPRRARSSSDDSNDGVGRSAISTSPETHTHATSSSSSLRSPRFPSRSAMKSPGSPTTTTPPRPRHGKKSGGVRWSLDDANGDGHGHHHNIGRGRLDSSGSSSSAGTFSNGAGSSGSSSSEDEEEEGDTCTTTTSHTTTTAAAHNRGGAASTPARQLVPDGDGDGDAEWTRKVRDMESRLEAALRRRNQRRRQATAASSCPADDELDCEIPYYDTLLGNLYFRHGGGRPSFYQRAEAHYRRAIEWCERRPRTGPRTTRSDDSPPPQTNQILLLADARANLGAVMWTTGRFDPAVATLEQALEGYERYSSSVAGARTRRVEGITPVDGSTSSLSASSLSASLSELDVRVANVWHQLGLAHCLRGHHGESLDCLQRALDLRKQLALSSGTPGHLPIALLADVATTHDAVGKVLACQGEWRTAVSHHQRAAELWLPCAPLRALAMIETIARACLQRPTLTPNTTDAIHDVKLWLDATMRRTSEMRSGGDVHDKEMVTVQREIRDAILALEKHLGLPVQK